MRSLKAATPGRTPGNRSSRKPSKPRAPRTTSSQKKRRVVLLAFDNLQLLDLCGPLEVFTAADRLLALEGRTNDGYRTQVVTLDGAPFRSSSGLDITAHASIGDLRGKTDTLLIPGGAGTQAAMHDEALISSIRSLAPRCRRVASACTGAFLLGQAGLLDNKKATTHWAATDKLARMFPKIEVDGDPIFIRQGRVWTSAGVTSGMDLALALVEDDYGRDIALDVARWLVLFLKRPGGQSQFSAQLVAQTAERRPLRELQSWILDHPGDDLSVETLADRVAMSPRNFSRVFTKEVGTTPARYVETVRVETARRRLEEGEDGIDEVAVCCGFGSSETMRRAFFRILRVGPSAYRSRFNVQSASA